MRTKAATTLLIGAGLAVLITGCGSGGSAPAVATAGRTAHPSSSPTPHLTDEEAQIRFAQCMRDHGVDMPDPKFNAQGGVSVTIPDGTSKDKVDAAQAACKQYLPNGGVAPKLSADQLENMRKMSGCMRAHGITKFPDPQSNGGIMIDGNSGIDPTSPEFQAAQSACAKYQPDGGKNGPGPVTSTDGGGGMLGGSGSGGSGSGGSTGGGN